MNGDEVLVDQVQYAESEEQRRFCFHELVHRYQTKAYGYCYAILGDARLAEDATQEAFLTAYRSLSQLRHPQAFSGWFQRILHSHSLRLLKEVEAATITMDDAVDFMSRESSPQMALEYQELQDAVRAVVHALPASQQVPVALFYLEEYSIQEIAERLHLSQSAVKKRLERARYLLEERMRDMAQDYFESASLGRGLTAELFSMLMEGAAAEGEYVLLETLLVEGLDVNEQDANGQTMLHWAARDGHLGAIELLLEYHPDLSRRDHAGQTALQLAVSGRHHRIAERLRQQPRPNALH